MRGYVTILPEEEFENWLAEKLEEKQEEFDDFFAQRLNEKEEDLNVRFPHKLHRARLGPFLALFIREMDL